MAQCLKFNISTNFGPANIKFYEKILHFFRKTQTSKTAIKSELRRSGTEISPKTRFRIILEGKLKIIAQNSKENDCTKHRDYILYILQMTVHGSVE